MVDVSQLIRDAWDNNDPYGWFEQLYTHAQKGDASVPWALMQPNPDLVQWLDQHQIDGKNKRALVVGCGLGDDAHELAQRGFNTTAFDVSPTAIQWAKHRFPHANVDFQVHDLFKTPESWRGVFDFVLEIRTIQSLPYTLAEQCMTQIASYVKPGGTLLVICNGREPEQERRGIPWALSTVELAFFHQLGLSQQRFEDLQNTRQFRVEYRKEENQND
ncbi:MAG: SAM-dependent methyltransferase [Phototrophicales bacterium]|nr:MAG: SAM-dependent methyltransferase [Phototrophicales bacterium]RMG72355.1 MAG: class I SAM-dependent methyltransferase [Chloroflexota bacterium]